MIERIRRVMARLAEDSDWDVSQPMKVEVAAEVEPHEGYLVQDSTTLEHTSAVARVGTGYYADLVRVAIAQGSRLDKHAIPVDWLRMTLARLEGRDAGIDEMWGGQRFEEGVSEVAFNAGLGVPSYDAIFRNGRPASSESTGDSFPA